MCPLLDCNMKTGDKIVGAFQCRQQLVQSSLSFHSVFGLHNSLF